MQTTRLILQDEYINLDDLTELDDATVFKPNELIAKSYEQDKWTQIDITFERDLN